MNQVDIIGIDCSTNLRKLGIARGVFSNGELSVTEVSTGRPNHNLQINVLRLRFTLRQPWKPGAFVVQVTKNYHCWNGDEIPIGTLKNIFKQAGLKYD